MGTNVVIPLGLMTPALGVEPRGGDLCVKKPTVQLIQTESPVKMLHLSKPVCQTMPSLIVQSYWNQTVFGWGTRACSLRNQSSRLTKMVTSKVLMRNPMRSSKKVVPGVVIGQVEPFVEASPEEILDCTVMTADEAPDLSGQVLSIEGDQSDLHWKKELEKLVKVGSEKLTNEKTKQIHDCILEAQDLFALTELERGEVVEVKHKIDTGKSSPVRQPPPPRALLAPPKDRTDGG